MVRCYAQYRASGNEVNISIRIFPRTHKNILNLQSFLWFRMLFESKDSFAITSESAGPDSQNDFPIRKSFPKNIYFGVLCGYLGCMFYYFGQKVFESKGFRITMSAAINSKSARPDSQTKQFDMGNWDSKRLSKENILA